MLRMNEAQSQASHDRDTALHKSSVCQQPLTPKTLHLNETHILKNTDKTWEAVKFKSKGCRSASMLALCVSVCVCVCAGLTNPPRFYSVNSEFRSESEPPV